MDKMDVILEKLKSLEKIESEIRIIKNGQEKIETEIKTIKGSQERMESDITAVKSDISQLHKKDNMIIKAIATMQEDITIIKSELQDHSLKIKIIDNKVKAL